MTTINTNIGAIAAQANMTKVNDQFNTAMTRLSTGLRINAAKDDAAGMAIGEKMTAQVMGLNQAVRNATDGKNLVDTTEGAHVEVSSMLQRLRELAVQSSNDTNTDGDRGSIGAESKQLIAEINRVAQDTTFNGMKILDGSFTNKQLQVGADSGQVIKINVDSAAATDIGAFKVKSDVKATATAANGITANVSTVITGSLGSATVTGAIGTTAKAMAGAINTKTSETGVAATAITKAKIDAYSTDATTVGMKINNVQLADTFIADKSDLSALRDSINDISAQTGVTASFEGSDTSAIILTDTTGGDIKISAYTNGAVTDTMAVTGLTKAGAAVSGPLTVTSAAANATVIGEVEMTSAKSFSVVGTAATDFFTAASNSADLESVAEIDLTTSAGASDAIKVIDVALEKISQSRSNLGALSNRLDSTISNLTSISTSVSAAKSNVMDADFAAESTNLARSQILTQAATAMLAQANSSKQGVMSLLKG